MTKNLHRCHDGPEFQRVSAENSIHRKTRKIMNQTSLNHFLKKISRILLCFFLFCVGTSFSEVIGAHTTGLKAAGNKILVLNSYHKGYKWSDDIVKGIEDSLTGNRYDIRVEYMDTKRIKNPGYLDLLAAMYRHKFSGKPFDLIISSDDTAFTFIREHHASIFKKAPVIACGLNYFDPETGFFSPQVKAVVKEFFDIKGTLDAALKIHPHTRTIYVINDQTPTGRLVRKAFDDVKTDYQDRVNFVSLESEDIKHISQVLANADQNSVGLLLVYLKDDNGIFYEPEQAGKLITGNAGVPVYGVWDFYLNHGIAGGVLTRGYGQGESAAHAAKHFLNGRKIPSRIIRESANSLVFDYNILNRFKISLSAVPRQAFIVNMKYKDQKNILILNSYDNRLKWTQDMVAGMISMLEPADFRKKIFIEYMDTNNFPGPENYSHLFRYYKYKYAHTQFDVILTTDDNAFRFALKNQSSLFHDAPLVFAGVNYLDNAMLKAGIPVTGIVETIDIAGTLEVMVSLHPESRNILVINDESTTGRANNRRVMEEITPAIREKVNIKLLEPTHMQNLLTDLKGLSPDTLLLLMTFKRDQNNDVFSYAESIDLISSHTGNPIYGVWDFYLGRGIVGGMLTSGREQGIHAAHMALKVLSGTRADTIPVVKKSHAKPMFDAKMLKQHQIPENQLPSLSRVINPAPSFFQRNPKLLRVGGIVLCLFGGLLIILIFRLRAQQKVRKDLEVQAHVDPLTQVLNRSAGMKALGRMINTCNRKKIPMVVCFADINQLKYANDTFGHLEGDRYIKLVAASIKAFVRNRDVVARIGGDEFLLLLMGQDLDSAANVVTRIKKQVARKGELENYPYPVGASFGKVLYDPKRPLAVEDLLEAADAEMYRNKNEASGSA